MSKEKGCHSVFYSFPQNYTEHKLNTICSDGGMDELIAYANFFSLHVIKKEKSFHELKQDTSYFVRLVETVTYGTLEKGSGRHQGDSFKSLSILPDRFVALCQLY